MEEFTGTMNPEIGSANKVKKGKKKSKKMKKNNKKLRNKNSNLKSKLHNEKSRNKNTERYYKEHYLRKTAEFERDYVQDHMNRFLTFLSSSHSASEKPKLPPSFIEGISEIVDDEEEGKK